MALKYKITDQQSFYFVTFTVVEWVDAFTRDQYREIFLDSVKHCQTNKGLIVGAWVVMTNHVHMVIGTNGNKLETIIRDLKSFTSRHIRLAIEENERESRKDWMLQLFRKAGLTNTNNNDFQFWIQNNHPIELTTGAIMEQRINYIHDNPVRAGFVTDATHWKWSSAHDYSGGHQGLLDVVILL